MDTEARADRDRPWSATRRVAKNTAYLALADVAGKTLAFLYYLLAARHLGVEKYGVLSFALAFTTMLGVLTDLGLGAVATREIARDRRGAQSQINNALAVRIVASVVVIAVIAGLANLFRYPVATVRVVYICSICVLLNAVSTLYWSVFQGFERMELLTLNRVAQTAVLVAGAVMLAGRAAVVERYAIVCVVAGVVSVLLACINAVPRLVRLEISLNVDHWRRLLRASAPVGLATVFTTFYYWIGTTLLSKMAGDSAVGNYSAAFRLAVGLGFVGMAFSGAVYPLFSRLYGSDHARLAQARESATRYMLMIVLPVAAFGTVFARPTVLFAFGSGYHDAIAILRVLVWWGASASLNSLLSNYLISVRRPGAVTVQTGLSLVVNIGLNLALIPVLGALGAAIAIIASEVIGLVYLTASLAWAQRRARTRSAFGSVLRVLTALVAALLVAAGVARWNWVAGLAAGLSTYAVMLVAVGAIGKQDMKMLRPWLRGSDLR
jgi:O-antigen/teichoic acid export membrane protein